MLLRPSASAAATEPRSSATQPGQGRWGQPRGPEGGWAFALAIDPANPETVYAGGWGNVFKSTNGGSTWRDVTTQPWTRVTALAIDPTRPEIVYAGTDRGIAKTVDGGRRWQMVNGGLLDGTKNYPRRVFGEGFIWSLVIDSRDPATGEWVDMVKAGIIDPAKVTRSALQNAASIAKNILTTEAIVAEAPEKSAPAPMGGGMPDMM